MEGVKERISEEGRLENLPRFLRFVEEACEKAGAAPAECFAVKLAVEEVCMNIITHGYGQERQGPIDITFESAPTEMVLRIADRAKPFDPAEAPPPDLNSEWQERRIGGLGWHLVRQMMDRVDYQTTPGDGNCLTLVKRIQ